MHRSHRLSRVFTCFFVLPCLAVELGRGQTIAPSAAPQPAPSPGEGSQPPRSAREEPTPAQLGTSEVLPAISWRDAGAYQGKEVFLIGKIVRTGRSRTGHVFLNFDQDYRNTTTIFIRKENAAKFPEPPQKAFRDKVVKVRGFIYEVKGQPNLSLASPDYITLLPDDTPLPAPSTRPATPATRPVPGDTITVGSYNVLNLFDAADDPYTADETTPPKPQPELEALARSIRTLNADVLALAEVENRGVLQQFVDLYLSDMNYQAVLLEGNDMRGIDVAVLSRLPVGPVTSHRHLRFPDTDGRPTHFQRDLLQVRIEPPDGAPFDLFVVHLKSKGGEDDGGLEIRLPEARQIRAILDARLNADPDAAFLIAGDFNDTIDSRPLQALIGSGPTALATFINDLPFESRVTYNRPPHRSMIDFILASPAMARRYVSESYKIVPGSPETTGSDHNPILAQFRRR